MGGSIVAGHHERRSVLIWINRDRLRWNMLSFLGRNVGSNDLGMA